MAIVGAGVAGPAAAALLARDGHSVSLFEQASPLRPVGAGLLLQPTGLAVLGHLGIGERMRSLGHRIDRLSGQTREGVPVLDLAYSQLGPGVSGLAVHRGALFETLLSAVGETNASIFAGVRIAACERAHSGKWLTADTGKRYGPFDLVFIADGARSALRDAVGIAARVRPYEWGAMWCVVPRIDAACDHTLIQHYDGTRRMLGFLPIGRATAAAAESVAVFWSIEAAQRERFIADGRDAWLAQACRVCPTAERFLSQVGSVDDFVFAAYSDVYSTRPWSEGVVLIGDAAHAMSPQLGQGANLALCDAWTLAAAIRESGSLHDAADRYRGERRGQLSYYRWASRLLTPWFQSSTESLGPVRDAVFPIVRTVPWIRRQMALSLAGVKSGLFSHDPVPRP